MQTQSAKDAKDGFSRLIDLSYAEKFTPAKHARPLDTVVSIQEYDRPKTRDTFNKTATRQSKETRIG